MECNITIGNAVVLTSAHPVLYDCTTGCSHCLGDNLSVPVYLIFPTFFTCRDKIDLSDDEYVPPDEENISLDETVSYFPVQCTSRKTTSGKKKQCVNNSKKLSDSNPDEMNSGIFVTNAGTCWKSITSGTCMGGRIAEHNVFNEKSGSTSYAKRNIENSYKISSWRLLIDEPVLRRIKNCTEEEAHWQLGKNKWSTTLDELDAFISILYA
ncbi:uncharacterized protein TNCV_4282811 [Trichonephila clavipes]|nr:uncharacterized protein TNCV_4282811 [Trichonephila clavipes]